MKRPFLASYKLTYRCNLSCAQCPFHRMEAPDPTFEQVVDTLDALRRRGNRIVIFEGGEPLLWKDQASSIHDVVRQAKRRFLRVGITTNGTLPLDVKPDVLWVSLDGLGATHDRLRGASIFDRVIHNIQESHHPKLFAHITINSVNYAEVPELIRFLTGGKPHALVRGVTIQFYYPYYGMDDLFLDFERREWLLDEVIALKKSGFPVLNSIPSLQALKRNTWRCKDWLIDNANPDGSLAQGCYVKGRSIPGAQAFDSTCARCGFSPHTEISLAFAGNLRSIRSGLRIFG